MRKLVVDERGIPIGEEEPFGGFDAELGENSFDDGFALPEEQMIILSRWKHSAESAWICSRDTGMRRFLRRKTRTMSRSSR